MVRFELVALDGVKLRETVHEVILPTPDGLIAVFAGHAPLVSVAAPGIIQVRHKPTDPDDFMDAYATNGGLIDISEQAVRVLVDEADHSEDIAAEEAQAALAAAQAARAEARDQLSLDAAQSAIDRSVARVQVAQLRRRKQRRK